MSHWDDIPDALVPDPADLPTLRQIVSDIREAIKVRHDLEEALSRKSGERRLAQRPFESDIGKKTSSTDPAIYNSEHQKLAGKIMNLINTLASQELKDFLSTQGVDRYDKSASGHSARIKRFLPNVSGGPGGQYLRILAGNDTVLDMLVPGREDMLIRLLLLNYGSWEKTISKLPVGTRHRYMRTDGVYYW